MLLRTKLTCAYGHGEVVDMYSPARPERVVCHQGRVRQHYEKDGRTMSSGRGERPRK